MSYAALLASVLLTGALLTSLTMSAAVAAAWRFLRSRAGLDDGGHPAILVGLRLVPTAAAVVATSLLGMAFFLFEPRDSVEQVPPLLAAAAGLEVALLLLTVRRGLGLHRRAREPRRAGPATRRYSGITLGYLGKLKVLAVDDVPGLVALAGILRPRLFVARDVLGSLTPEELAAAFAHEEAHRRDRDNLRDLGLALLPDPLALTGTATEIEEALRRSRERSADATVAASGQGLALAAAVLKVARLASAPRAAVALACLHDGGPLAARVHALLDPTTPRTVRRGLAWASSLAEAAAVVLAVTHPLLLLRVHDLIEAAVRFGS